MAASVIKNQFMISERKILPYKKESLVIREYIFSKFLPENFAKIILEICGSLTLNDLQFRLQS